MLNSEKNLIYGIIFQTWRISERPHNCRGFIKLIFFIAIVLSAGDVAVVVCYVFFLSEERRRGIESKELLCPAATRGRFMLSTAA